MASRHRDHDGAALTRRAVLRGGAGLAAAALLPLPARAAPLVDPYTGAIPLRSPLPAGTYQTPVRDNWHAGREGRIYPWSHRARPTVRAHDGVDLYPPPGAPLPPVYAPVTGYVAATCWRAANRVESAPLYQEAADPALRPPWDYSAAVDDVIDLPLYGNFVWLYSTDPASAGYFIFYCHLQPDPVLRALAPGQMVTAETQVGLMGDTGNAEGESQLHVEIHYPVGTTYICQRCNTPKAVSSFDSFASLRNATPRVPRRITPLSG